MSDHQLLLMSVSLSAFAAGAQLAALISEVASLLRRRRQIRRLHETMRAQADHFFARLRAQVAEPKDGPSVH